MTIMHNEKLKIFIFALEIPNMMSRLIGIDYGMKRVGIAVTDPLRHMAMPLTTLVRTELVTYLANYLAEHTVDAFVLGMPMSATDTPMQRAVRQLATRLKKRFPSQSIFFQDEAYTSQEALALLVKGNFPKKKRRQKGYIDQISATLILRDFMDEHPDLHTLHK